MNYEKIDAYEKIACFLEGAQERYQMYALWYVQIRDGDKRRCGICHYRSGGQTASLHTYHTKVKMVVPVRRNGTTNEVAQGRDT
jgi:hypothetical protein